MGPHVESRARGVGQMFQVDTREVHALPAEGGKCEYRMYVRLSSTWRSRLSVDLFAVFSNLGAARRLRRLLVGQRQSLVASLLQALCSTEPHQACRQGT